MKNKKGIVYKRKQRILQVLKEQKTVNVEDLARDLSVSAITIRRDLQEFEQSGIVERFYGGANLVEGALSEDPSQDSQNDQAQRCKHAVARRAAALVEDGDTIFLNSSSTALLMLEYLSGKRVTVITNNGNALAAKRDPMVELVLTGGEVYGRKNSLVGDFALQALGRLRANKCFVGVSGINEKGEISTSVLQETAVNDLMIQHSNNMVVILADSGKIGHQNNFIIATTDQATHIVTDERADAKVLSLLERPGLEILRAPLEEAGLS